MSGKLQAIRGMRDLLPPETHQWRCLEELTQSLFERYGYQEIRTPILEKTELFHRSIGELTDIVSKEMYSFDDKNGDGLTLRPEGTASTVRAGIEHGLFSNQQVQKLWYRGPMFRHERPQLGRQRQFHQIGVEAFGLEGPDIDAELLLMTARLWQELNIQDVSLEINSLGTTESRASYREKLIEYFSNNKDQLDEDSLKRLEKNPLRILDSKNPDLSELIKQAPEFFDYIDDESKAHFDTLCEYLSDNNVEYIVNPRLVRGLDYYSKTVFEWVTEQLGAQGTICAGGRYDGLVTQFSAKPTPAIGFAMGVERIMGLLEANQQKFPEYIPSAYLICVGDGASKQGIQLAEKIRSELNNFSLICHHGGGSFKSQFKKADKSGAKLALILGEVEVQNQTIGIKFLREDKEQITCAQSELTAKLSDLIV